MFAKHTKGSGFRGVCDYLLGPGKDNKPDRSQIIGGTMASSDARGLASEFGQIDRGDVKKPVLHVSLNAAPGEHLSDEQWQRIAHDYMRKHGIDHNYQHVIVRHSDRDHDHVHLVINRRGLDGQLAREKRGDFELARKYCREIEREHGLQEGEQRPQADKGLVSEMRVKAIAARDQSRGKGFAEFKANLEKEGIKTIEFRHKESGKLNGLAFQSDGHARVKAGDLGDEFRTKSLVADLSPAQKMSSTTTPKLPTTTAATKQTGATVGKEISGAISKMQGVPKIPKLPQLPGMGGLTGQIGKSVAMGMAGALKSLQQQAGKSQKKARDHEFE